MWTEDANQRFSESVTGTAFNLSLTKNMVRALSQFDYSGKSFESFMTVSALRSRGLVQHHGDHWTITEAGEKVVELIKLAGVYEPCEEMMKRMGVAL